MQIIYLQKNRWWTYCLFFLYACHAEPSAKKVVAQQTPVASLKAIDAAAALILDGDVITRTGNDFTSETLRILNRRDKTYSHCGLALREHDSVFVYHAIGGDFNPEQKLRRDPLAVFLEPFANRGFGIFRFETDSSFTGSVRNVISLLYNAGLPYDMDFDLATDDRMYCSEFVAKTVEQASRQTIRIPRTRLKEMEYIGTDDIFLHPLCKKITSAVFK